MNSTAGEGSTFWFTLNLPLAPRAAILEMTPQAGVSRNTTQRRILVVDDLEVNRALAKAILEQAGHVVETAIDGAQALAKVRVGGFDTVLMDLNMPGMDGFEATVRIRTLVAEPALVRIIALTASATAGDIMRCKQVGMDGHVSKPIDRRALLEIIDSDARWQKTASVPINFDVRASRSSQTLDDEHLDELERYLGRASIAGMAGMVIRRIEKMEPRLIALVAARDRRMLAREAHSIVSMASNLGALELSLIFRRIEVESLGASSASPLARTPEGEIARDELLEQGLLELQTTVRALRKRYRDVEMAARP